MYRCNSYIVFVEKGIITTGSMQNKEGNDSETVGKQKKVSKRPLANGWIRKSETFVQKKKKKS